MLYIWGIGFTISKSYDFSTLATSKTTIPHVDKITSGYIIMKTPPNEPYHLEARSCPARCVPAQQTVQLLTKIGKPWYRPILIGLRTLNYLSLLQPFPIGAQIALHIMQLQFFHNAHTHDMCCLCWDMTIHVLSQNPWIQDVLFSFPTAPVRIFKRKPIMGHNPWHMHKISNFCKHYLFESSLGQQIVDKIWSELNKT